MLIKNFLVIYIYELMFLLVMFSLIFIMELLVILKVPFFLQDLIEYVHYVAYKVIKLFRTALYLLIKVLLFKIYHLP